LDYAPVCIVPTPTRSLPLQRVNGSLAIRGLRVGEARWRGKSELLSAAARPEALSHTATRRISLVAIYAMRLIGMATEQCDSPSC